jgi:hypothetical protein
MSDGVAEYRWVAVEFAKNGKPIEPARATSYTVRIDGRFVKETRLEEFAGSNR